MKRFAIPLAILTAGVTTGRVWGELAEFEVQARQIEHTQDLEIMIGLGAQATLEGFVESNMCAEAVAQLGISAEDCSIELFKARGAHEVWRTVDDDDDPETPDVERVFLITPKVRITYDATPATE